ncbi:DEAD/DEAH box helicase [Streptomyces sp. CBMA152]|uniref:DEAD/DEAH box helicase n=1 Tax=Streptomyces sp. CBMA152 TaxID=1896312 RepID=UPI00166078D4|nr:DEAD/DEAH box helicase [Streptomyces sp. CBMA152]MBD0743616.1 hypothetical protein [Streptomyces sp. CBMA152]
MTVQLRPYQQEAVTAITADLSRGGTGQLRAACGSGKTMMGVHAVRRMTPGREPVAVLVPSLALAAQTVQVWRSQHAEALSVLAVCSDDTVTGDSPVHIEDVDAPVTTDAARIARWLQEESTGPRLIVSTYHSCRRLSEALHHTGTVLHTLIYDEAHHLTGPTDAALREVTQPRLLPAKRRLFMTATPRVYAGQARADLISMDDTGLFGEVLYDYPFSRGIAEGYLEDYRVFVVGIAASESRALLADTERDYVDGPGAPSLQTLVAQAALVRAAQQFGVRRAVVFHHRVQDAAEFARTLRRTAAIVAPELSPPQSAIVHGTMAQAVREKILDQLRHPGPGEWVSVSNVRVLGEGVDVPAIDAVLFAHAKSSAVDIVQAVGRALRPHPDTPGPSTVIVPLILPPEENEVGDLEPGDYSTVWEVLRALRAHDAVLGSELDRQRSHGHSDEVRLPSKITVQLPPGTSADVLRQVSLMLVRQTTSSWWDGYAAASTWHAEHGHLDIPLRHSTAAGFKLGQWLAKQREFRRKGWLAPDRVQSLEKLGITWDPSEARWQAAYRKAVAFHAEHGHLDINSKHPQLGNWILHQRRYRQEGTLAEHRIAALDEIGMIWQHRTNAWQRNLDALAAYAEEHGTTLVPQRYVTPEGLRLGAWLSQMRAKRAAGKLPAQRIADLEDAGVVWRVEVPTRTARALAAAASWHEQHGHLDVPYTDRYDDIPLGNWLARQRSAHAKGELPTTVKEALDALGFSWADKPPRKPAARDPETVRSRSNAVWQRGYAIAVAFFDQHGHLTPPARCTFGGIRIDAWVARQRAARRQGSLSDDRIRALDALGINWN